MRTFNELLRVAAMGMGLWVLGVPDASASGQIVRCEAQGQGYTHCRAFIRGQVQLYRQLSGPTCRFNQNWGYDADGIWVTSGCRADFIVDGGGRGEEWNPRDQDEERDWGRDNRGHGGRGDRRGGQVVRCESQGNQYQRCPADTRGGVSLQRQLSQSRCVKDRSWGYDRGGIWVSEGCRAEFYVGDSGPEQAQRIFRCESDGGYRYCRADTRDGVRFLRQISRSMCVYNKSWGYDRGGVWVDRGCRAEFAVR